MAFTETRLDKILGTGSGTGTRPAAGNAGARWIDTTGPTETFDNGTAWVAVGGGVAGTLTSASTILAASVTMTNANTYYDGPSVVLAAGTWLVLAGVSIGVTGTGGGYTAKLWDGTTVATSAYFGNVAGLAYFYLTLSTIVVLSVSATYKVSAASAGAGNTIQIAAATNTAGNNVSWINAVKIA